MMGLGVIDRARLDFCHRNLSPPAAFTTRDNSGATAANGGRDIPPHHRFDEFRVRMSLLSQRTLPWFA